LKYRGLISYKIQFGYKSAINDLGPRVPAKMKYTNLDFATNDYEKIFSSALKIYEKNFTSNDILKSVVIVASNLVDEFYQVEQLTI
jgi:hypothetical protein